MTTPTPKIGDVISINKDIESNKWVIVDISNGKYKCIGINNMWNKYPNGENNDYSQVYGSIVNLGQMNLTIAKILYK